MICDPCTKTIHEICKGGTWCDCQHKPTGGHLVRDTLPPAQVIAPEAIESEEKVWTNE